MIKRVSIWVCEKCGMRGSTHFYEHSTYKGGFCRGKVVEKEVIFLDDLVKLLPVCNMDYLQNKRLFKN